MSPAAFTDNITSIFLTLIQKRLGIVIHSHQIKDLEITILEACKKFNCIPQEYLQMITTCAESSPVLEHLIAGITIGETYFFRDNHQIQLLEKTLLPRIIAKKRAEKNLSLRIWSAGCSTGEEIYTIAMLLKNLLPDSKAWKIHLLGTDLNTTVLKKAIAAHYGSWSMRSITDYYKKTYFTTINNKFILTPEISSMAEFAYLNLKDKTYPSLANSTNAQDLILCRNVLIYFDTESIMQLMAQFSLSLADEGYLLLGASDPIITTGTPLIFHHQNGMLFSNKKLVASPIVTAPKPNSIPATIQSTLPASVIKNPQTSLAKGSPQTNISQLISNAKWHDALTAISHVKLQSAPTAELLAFEATALANIGNLSQALVQGRESCRLDPTNKQTHFTLAMILIELNQLVAAEDEFRKTLFLDHQFVMGHFQLGLLLLRKKEFTAGIKCLRNSLAITTKQNPTAAVPGFIDLTYDRLKTILTKEIDLHINNQGET
jgi:chemotaxis protein methyltransferase CheR